MLGDFDMKLILRVLAAILGFLMPVVILFTLALLPGSFITIPLFLILSFIFGIICGIIGFFIERVQKNLDRFFSIVRPRAT